MENELKYMNLAVEIARQCRSEEGHISPKVGAVVVKGDEILAKAFRGEMDPGDHAEFTALERKSKFDAFFGSTLYVTLEPCTERNPPKEPCVDRIIARKIRKVVIGMLDPNQNITGKGILSLRRAGIEVELFPSSLMTELEELNRDFIKDQERVKSKESEKRHVVSQNGVSKSIKDDLDSNIEDSIIALCSPYCEISIKEIFSRLGIDVDDNASILKVNAAIGRLKKDKTIINSGSLNTDSIKLKETFK